jgi:HEAT repeat protein
VNSNAQQLEALRTAVEGRDKDALWTVLGALDQCSDAVPMLVQLLLEDWHEVHEDVAFELGLTGDPRAIEALSRAARIPFAHLVKWGNLHEFQRKCAYALARIGTNESRAALEDLSREADPKLREYGEEGLAHWPMPYRP